MEKHVDPRAEIGLRIRLIKMYDEQPVDAEMEGTINRIDDIGTLHVIWDDGRTLGIIPGVDEYQLLPPENEQVGIEVFESSDTMSKKYNRQFKSALNSTKPKVKLESDVIKGGLADKLTVKDLAKKHDVSVEDIKKEIKLGIPIEMEHVNSKGKAREIVMDHITEFPDFYSNEKHGALATEKGLKKIHENSGTSVKDEVQRILSTIKTAQFQHKDSIEKMINNFYNKHKGTVSDVDKLTEIYTNLLDKLESKFNVEETTAAAGGGSTGAFVGPLSTKKNENKTIRISDVLTEVSRVNKLRNDGAFDGNSWVGDKDKDGWNFNDTPAWEGGEIVDILAKLDIDWKDEDLTVMTNESFKKSINEGWLIKTKEDRVALNILKRVKEVFPADAKIQYNTLEFSLPGVERNPVIEVDYGNNTLGDKYSYIRVNGKTLEASTWVTKKLYNYMYYIIQDGKENKDFRRIQADLTDPEFAQDFFDELNESFWGKPKKEPIEIGDTVKVTKFEGEPEGVVYDIRNGSYWVDLGVLGKMEFSDFELVKLNNTTNEGLIKEGENGTLAFVVLFLSSVLSQVPIKQWPQYFAENSRDMFTDFLKFMKRFGYDIDIDYVKNNFNSLIKKALGKLYKEGGVNQELEETTTFASALGDSGTYVGPAFAAPDGKHGPSKKPIWKGGTIVQDIKSDGVLVAEMSQPLGSSDPYKSTTPELTNLYSQLRDFKPNFTHKKDALKIMSKGIEISYDTNSKEYEIIDSSSGGKYYNKVEHAGCHDCAFMKPEHVIEFVGGVSNVPVNEINDVKFVKDSKYVKLKDKCTKFNNQPWCDSGNASDPLELSDTTMESIDNISETYNISREVILEKIKTRLKR